MGLNIPIQFTALVRANDVAYSFSGSIVRGPSYRSREVQPEPLAFEIESVQRTDSADRRVQIRNVGAVQSLVEDFFDEILLPADEAYGRWLFDQMAD